MKISVTKTLQTLFNKKNINILKKFLKTGRLIIGASIIIFILISTYLLRPYFFDHNIKKEIIKEKIEKYLKVETNIKGNVDYNFFPTPRFEIKNLELKFNNSGEAPLKIEKSNFLISPFKLQSINKIEIKKITIINQKIQIFPNQIKKYLLYFNNQNVENLIFKNCDIFFTDSLNNNIFLNDLSLKNSFNKKQKNIQVDAIFANNKFKINFINKRNDEKYLNFYIPSLKTYLKIIFDKNSNLEKSSGKLNLKILNNILLLNFDGEEVYKISQSFFRNKIFNSKLDGTINIKDNFYFDLNSNISQINLRKLSIIEKNSKKNKISDQIKISKKINGKVNVKIKSADSYLGKIRDTNFVMFFENGDIKIKSGSSNFDPNTNVKFNISVIGKGKDQKINFFVNFLSTDGKKFLKKLNIYTDRKDISFTTAGFINLMKRDVKFNNLTVNNEKLNNSSINEVQESFKDYVIKESSLGFLNFFKIKKFLKNLSEIQ